MKYIIPVIVALCILVSCDASSEKKITEYDVQQMMSRMAEAAKSQNIDRFMSSFSEDAMMTFDMPESMGGKMEVGVQEYRSMLKQNWALPAKFTYEIMDVRIDVDPGGLSATASDRMIETMEMNGQVIISLQSEEHIEIISKNGKPLIVKFYGKLVD